MISSLAGGGAVKTACPHRRLQMPILSLLRECPILRQLTADAFD